MKYLLMAVFSLCILSGVGYVVYSVVLRNEIGVMSGETDGIEAIRPRDMRISDNNGNSFVVEWATNTPVSGYIKYGDTSTTLSLIAQDVEGIEAKKEHRVRVENLTPGKKYYFWVMSDDIAFGRDSRALEVLTSQKEAD